MCQNYIWDDTYAIACALKEDHPDEELENVTLKMVYRWALALENFIDDPELANGKILTEIFQEWL